MSYHVFVVSLRGLGGRGLHNVRNTISKERLCMVRNNGDVLERGHHVLSGEVEDSTNGWDLCVLATNGLKH